MSYKLRMSCTRNSNSNTTHLNKERMGKFLPRTSRSKHSQSSESVIQLLRKIGSDKLTRTNLFRNVPEKQFALKLNLFFPTRLLVKCFNNHVCAFSTLLSYRYSLKIFVFFDSLLSLFFNRGGPSIRGTQLLKYIFFAQNYCRRVWAHSMQDPNTMLTPPRKRNSFLTACRKMMNIKYKPLGFYNLQSSLKKKQMS